MSNERDKSAPLRESFPRPSELLNERDPHIVRKRWQCKNGHTFVVEGDGQPKRCPQCV